ncbi:uncharacterized protein LOC142973184 [Anticarsia gemmatalis]|uniref:uncharacterized protein LOC142973184 n=1 Tax=Anticarsia gemmatalis TaxID=129554 RepID=UPI003F76BE94
MSYKCTITSKLKRKDGNSGSERSSESRMTEEEKMHKSPPNKKARKHQNPQRYVEDAHFSQERHNEDDYHTSDFNISTTAAVAELVDDQRQRDLYPSGYHIEPDITDLTADTPEDHNDPIDCLDSFIETGNVQVPYAKSDYSDSQDTVEYVDSTTFIPRATILDAATSSDTRETQSQPEQVHNRPAPTVLSKPQEDTIDLDPQLDREPSGIENNSINIRVENIPLPSPRPSLNQTRQDTTNNNPEKPLASSGPRELNQPETSHAVNNTCQGTVNDPMPENAINDTPSRPERPIIKSSVYSVNSRPDAYTKYEARFLARTPDSRNNNMQSVPNDPANRVIDYSKLSSANQETIDLTVRNVETLPANRNATNSIIQNMPNNNRDNVNSSSQSVETNSANRGLTNNTRIPSNANRDDIDKSIRSVESSSANRISTNTTTQSLPITCSNQNVINNPTQNVESGSGNPNTTTQSISNSCTNRDDINSPTQSSANQNSTSATTAPTPNNTNNSMRNVESSSANLNPTNARTQSIPINYPNRNDINNSTQNVGSSSVNRDFTDTTRQPSNANVRLSDESGSVNRNFINTARISSSVNQNYINRPSQNVEYASANRFVTNTATNRMPNSSEFIGDVRNIESNPAFRDFLHNYPHNILYNSATVDLTNAPLGAAHLDPRVINNQKYALPSHALMGFINQTFVNTSLPNNRDYLDSSMLNVPNTTVNRDIISNSVQTRPAESGMHSFANNYANRVSMNENTMQNTQNNVGPRDVGNETLNSSANRDARSHSRQSERNDARSPGTSTEHSRSNATTPEPTNSSQNMPMQENFTTRITQNDVPGSVSDASAQPRRVTQNYVEYLSLHDARQPVGPRIEVDPQVRYSVPRDHVQYPVYATAPPLQPLYRNPGPIYENGLIELNKRLEIEQQSLALQNAQIRVREVEIREKSRIIDNALQVHSQWLDLMKEGLNVFQNISKQNE